MSKLRKIPIINVFYNNVEEVELLTKEDKWNDYICSQTLEAIEDGIKYNKPQINLFEVERTNIYISLKRDRWKQALNQIIKRLENTSQYEECSKCVELINKI